MQINPNRLNLFSLATPNGQKVSVALEEMGLDYEAHRIDILKGDQFTEEFVRLNPNSKIPALYDPQGPDGEPLSIMESGAILIYLAEKSGKFLPQDSRQRNVTLQWLFFQVGHIGPMFGQFGHFYKYAKEQCDHPYPVKRYTDEAKRLLKVLDRRLEESSWIAGAEYSIADMAIFPWVECLRRHYEASDQLNLDSYTRVIQWLETCLERPGVKKGMGVCGLDDN